MPRGGKHFCDEFKFQFVVDFEPFLPRSLLLTRPRLQGVSHKGYVSKPPIPECHGAANHSRVAEGSRLSPEGEYSGAS